MRQHVTRVMVRTLLGAGSLWLAGCASVAHTPHPPIQADRSPEAVKRGEGIFRGACESCHRGPDSERASGARMTEIPGWMGTFHTANLTAHPTAGIGAAKDEALARVIRYGVSRDGRMTLMPSYAMGDADVAAVLGYLRSEDALFTPDPTPAPPQRFSFIGGLGFGLLFKPPQHPASGIPVPPKGPTVEYGRYMAQAVYDCGACHSPGLNADRAEGEKAFTGGFEFVGADGQPLYSSNITFDATGLKGWSFEDFAMAVSNGLAPGGQLVRWPMPRFRGADETDLRALYEYLRSLPPKHNVVKGARPRTAPGAASVETAAEPGVSTVALEPGSPQRTSGPAGSLVTVLLAQSGPDKPAGATEPAALFSKLGCALCHNPGARYHDKILRSVNRSPEELARWIRNPEKFVPGTPMPTYASLIDEPTALALARWLKEAGPGAPTHK